MTQKQKELLLKDLSARQTCGVLIQEEFLVHDKMFLPDEETDRLINIDVSDWTLRTNGGSFYHIDEIKPYLFPLSSMTDEQKKYIADRWGINEDFNFEIDPDWGEYLVTLYDVIEFIDWLNENHFDYRGLIKKGLSIDATGLNIY